MDSATSLCYLLAVLIAICFLVWGFMEILKKDPSASPSDYGPIISRQIRGFAFIMLAQVILVVGAMLCFGMSGGVESLGRSVRKMSR